MTLFNTAFFQPYCTMTIIYKMLTYQQQLLKIFTIVEDHQSNLSQKFEIQAEKAEILKED